MTTKEKMGSSGDEKCGSNNLQNPKRESAIAYQSYIQVIYDNYRHRTMTECYNSPPV
jgi:hypothetical protein